VQIKKYYPEIKSILTAAMIDKRLRQLDQIPEIDYWRDGYDEHKAETRAARQAELFAKNRSKLERKENKPVPTLLPAANLRVGIPTNQHTAI
jgi:hypothetical protein